MLAIVINGAKWQVLMRAQGVRVPFGAVLRFIFAGFFFNNFLPANVGGDVSAGSALRATPTEAQTQRCRSSSTG